jgi:membrane protease YdiL (CAAX protease family)
MKNKTTASYLIYMLSLIVFFICGAVFVNRLHDLIITNGIINPYYSIIVILYYMFPLILGMLFAMEHIWVLTNKKEKVKYNLRRFCCVTVPPLMLLLYYFISIYGIFNPQLPLLPYIRSLPSALLFFIGYTLLTNIIPATEVESIK